METLKLKKLASVPSEDSFESSTSKHFIVEDGGELKRLSADSVGSEPFVVTFSGTDINEDAACDKTWAEIEEAYNSKKSISAKYQIGSGPSLLTYDLLISKTNRVLQGIYYVVPEPEDLGNGYTIIQVWIEDSGVVHCKYSDM